MTTSLIYQYLDYHTVNHHYQRIVDLINRWDGVFGLKDRYYNEYITALYETSSFDSLRIELPDYLLEEDLPERHLMAARTYTAVGDTLLGIYFYSKYRNTFPNSEIIPEEYIPILFRTKLAERGKQILRDYLEEVQNVSLAYWLSEQYEKDSSYLDARLVLKDYATTDDSLTYRISALYKAEQKWDSAILYVDHVLKKDSTDRDALWKMGRLYEDRGWLSYSRRFFVQMIKMDSLDTAAVNQLNVIDRKIAYLQRKKFEESKLPLKELVPKKLIDN
jgi:tetratricopeptide (TPR) repeat protein